MVKGIWTTARQLVATVLCAAMLMACCATAAANDSTRDTWVIYWYICGTDLESDGGLATANIDEMMQVKLPDNVKVVIETGGATKWHNNIMPGDAIGRYLYDKNGLHELAVLPDADMGSQEVFTDFLRFGKDNFPADHQAFIFWNHGGGSVAGVAYDEKYRDMLTLNKIRAGFEAVYSPNDEQPPFDMIGFDACLMATIDVAHDLHGLASYMTASEETEPGNGWDYNGMLSALADNQGMDGRGLGQVICDTYLAKCYNCETADTATLSVIDLSKLPALRDAYDAVGLEALQNACNDPNGFFPVFARDADESENYGGNTREQGYTNMVDLGDLVRNAQAILPGSSERMLSELQNAVVYRVNGPYREHSSGLSCYYSFDGDIDNLNAYNNVWAARPAFKCLYTYLANGEMPAGTEEFLAQAAVQPTKPVKFNIESLEGTPVTVNEDGSAAVQLSPEAMQTVASVRFQLACYDPDENFIMLLGSDADIEGNWDNGIFKDNFNGRWACLDGHVVYMEITYDGSDYNTYSVPIMLNGTEYNLQVAYNFKEKDYRILGARRSLENGMADKKLVQLKKGDEVTTLHYGMKLSGNEADVKQIPIDTFKIGDKPKFADEDLGDGKFAYMFEFVDPHNKSANSKTVFFDVKGDKIYTSAEEK